MGIEHGLLPLIFQLFTQGKRALDRRQGGLGLGLSLVKSLIEMHGGTVAAESEGPGKGSEFVVRLPMVPAPDSHAVPPPARPVAPVEEASLRLLVVDDNADMARLFGMLLRRSGHQVRTANTGQEALQTALEFHPQVVLLDIGLPGMDGYEVARRIRLEETLRDIVLVAMTGYGQAEDMRRSEEAGFDHHLVKPADMEVLQRILAAAAEAKTLNPVRPRSRV